MADVLYADMTYCTLCDRYFPGEEARAQHVQLSSNHPKCNTCDRRFANKNSLRNHWVYSRRHHYCAVCERDFRTAAGLRVHIEYAAVHRDDSDDDDDGSDDDSIDDSAEGWEDELGLRVFPEEDERGDGDGESSDADYWTEDEEDELEEERETYYGFARATPRESAAPQDGAEGEQAANFSAGSSEPEKKCYEMEKPPASGVLFSCPLCLEAPKESSATRCGHLFCTSCIKTALSMKKMCPVCREFALPRQLRKIYLSAA
ncbi:hypothetical protein NM688_g7040 [Phlebia brevispora]|uniref:Uncharacterized protein n=1 Tax=Phlebia brevispora TaxID=194682 RepID=A0ACC1S9M4_9APHY|nr:hypothetical protein NM688_g7040 [Phlebia brevispora]